MQLSHSRQPHDGRQRYALMPSLTARPTPHRLTTTRNGPAGTFLTIFGPIQPPARKPAASGTTRAHRTSPNNAKHAAAVAFAIPETAFFTAFTVASDASIIMLSTTSNMTPAAAPKYPTYMATANRATTWTTLFPPSADGASRLILGWMSSISEAPPISTGTTMVEVLAGVSSSQTVLVMSALSGGTPSASSAG